MKFYRATVRQGIIYNFLGELEKKISKADLDLKKQQRILARDDSDKKVIGYRVKVLKERIKTLREIHKSVKAIHSQI